MYPVATVISFWYIKYINDDYQYDMWKTFKNGMLCSWTISYHIDIFIEHHFDIHICVNFTSIWYHFLTVFDTWYTSSPHWLKMQVENYCYQRPMPCTSPLSHNWLCKCMSNHLVKARNLVDVCRTIFINLIYWVGSIGRRPQHLGTPRPNSHKTPCAKT